MALLHSTNAIRHFLIFLKSLNIWLPFCVSLPQTSWIKHSQFECVDHFSFKCLGCLFFLLRPMGGSVDIRIGTWSKYVAWRWVTFTCGNRALHLIVPQALSNLSWTKPSPTHPFLQVNMLPWNPKSTNPQCKGASLNSCIGLRGRASPPYFSSIVKISLKSP